MGKDSKSDNRYLLKYLYDNTNDILKKKYIDYFKIELDWFLYNYGEHINESHIRTKSKTFKDYLVSIVRDLNSYIALTPKNTKSKNILSSVYSMSRSSLTDLGFYPFSSMVQPLGKKDVLGNYKSREIVKNIDKIIRQGSFNELNNSDLFSNVEELKNILKKYFIKYDLKGMLTYTGQYYSSKILIDIFRDIQKPSFIFSHGLPGIYSLDVDNNSDYLMVWGDKIKENYVNIGFDPNKIYVTGNPRYVKFDLNVELKSSLDNILVIPCSSILWHQHEWGNPLLIDRSLVILYLYQVQNVLERLGVKHSRVRPHPAISKKWLANFIDNDFYSFDNDNLTESLTKSSIVIGAPSTTFIDAIIAGRNYVVYNPISIFQKDVPPFDGSDSDMFIATNEEDLFSIIKNKYIVKSKIIEKYIKPLDLTILNKLIN